MNEGTLARPQQGVAKMPEVSGNTGQVGGGSEKLRGGVYRHPQTGEEIIALDDPITGDAQARGYVRAGFEFVREVKEGEVTSVGLNVPSEDFAKQPQRQVEDQTELLKGLVARMSALETENAKLREQKATEASSATATELSQQAAQVAAEEQTEVRGTDNTGNNPVQTETPQPQVTNAEAPVRRRGRRANAEQEAK